MSIIVSISMLHNKLISIFDVPRIFRTKFCLNCFVRNCNQHTYM